MKRFKRTILTVLALMLSVGPYAQARAQENPLTVFTASSEFTSGSVTQDLITATFTGHVEYNDGWVCRNDGSEANLTITAAEGITITSVRFVTLAGTEIIDEEAPFQIYFSYDLDDEKAMLTIDWNNFYEAKLTAVEVYGYSSPDIELTEVTPGKEWRFQMPANNVMLTPEYEPTTLILASNDSAMGTVQLVSEQTVVWDRSTMSGWTVNGEHTANGITITNVGGSVGYSSQWGLYFVLSSNGDYCTFTSDASIYRIEMSLTDVTGFTANNNWTIYGDTLLVWEGELSQSVTIATCSVAVSQINFYTRPVLDGVTKVSDGTYSISQTGEYTVKAVSTEGHKFLYWADDETNTDPVRTLTIEIGEADTMVTAVFDRVPYTVFFTTQSPYTIQDGKATVSVDGQAVTLSDDGILDSIYKGQEVTLTAAQGYKFREVETTKGIHQVTAITLDNIAIDPGVNNGRTINVHYTPSNATFLPTLVWESSRDDISVDENGFVWCDHTSEIEPFDGTITVYVKDNPSIRATCNVMVDL